MSSPKMYTFIDITSTLLLSTDFDTKTTELTRQLKDEKLEKKTLNNRLQGIEEELGDAKAERDTLEKVSAMNKSNSVYLFECKLFIIIYVTHSNKTRNK